MTDTKTDIDSGADNEELLPSRKAFAWARHAMAEGWTAEATKRWAILRKAYPDHEPPWVEGAQAHIQNGQPERAEELLAHARHSFPESPEALLATAELALAQGRLDDAEHTLQQVRRQHPEKPAAWLKSAECAALRNQFASAFSYNEQARNLLPERPRPLIQYAELAMQAEQWATAVEGWKRLRERFPDLDIGQQQAQLAAEKLRQARPTEAGALTRETASPDDRPAPDSSSLPSRAYNHRFRRLTELVWTKALFNLRSEVQRNYLSYGWWILEPLLHMVVYYVVFGMLLMRGGENYAVFLLTGLIPWMWFLKTVSGSSNSIIGGQGLMILMGTPSIIFPLTSILQATLKQIPVFALLFLFVWLQGYPPGIHWLALVPIIVVQALLITACAAATAAVIPFARDLSYLVPTGLTFLMFMSGIFYDYRNISPDWQGVFLLNPIAFLLKSYREVFIEAQTPDFQTLLLWGAASLIVCVLLMALYQKLRYIYPRIVME